MRYLIFIKKIFWKFKIGKFTSKLFSIELQLKYRMKINCEKVKNLKFKISKRKKNLNKKIQ